MNSSQESHARRYVILTQDILEDSRITLAEKIVLARISGFEIFFESAEETAERLGISAETVRKAKQNLAKLGLITEIADTGRGKQYVASFLDESRLVNFTNQPGKFYQSDWQILPAENKERLKRELKENKTKEKTEPDQPQQFGNPDINALLDAWAEATGFNYKNQKMERYAMAGLLKTHGPEATKALINRVKLARRSGDRFAPQIAKPSQLRGKYSKFEALTLWAERREAEQSKAPTAPIIPKNPDYFYEDPDAYDTGETREEIHERCEKLREKYGFGPRRELD